MKCKECKKAEATEVLNSVELCELCFGRLQTKLKDIGKMFDVIRDERRDNMQMFGNPEGSIDSNEYWGRKGESL